MVECALRHTGELQWHPTKSPCVSACICEVNIVAVCVCMYVLVCCACVRARASFSSHDSIIAWAIVLRTNAARQYAMTRWLLLLGYVKRFKWDSDIWERDLHIRKEEPLTGARKACETCQMRHMYMAATAEVRETCQRRLIPWAEDFVQK